jgi:hypothetical protein
VIHPVVLPEHFGRLGHRAPPQTIGFFSARLTVQT